MKCCCLSRLERRLQARLVFSGKLVKSIDNQIIAAVTFLIYMTLALSPETLLDADNFDSIHTARFTRTKLTAFNRCILADMKSHGDHKDSAF